MWTCLIACCRRVCARNGTAFTSQGTVSIKGGFNKADFRPIEEGCACFACRNFTRAYLRHLLNVGEILGLRMLSVHNSYMYLKLMADIRAHLAAGTFAEFRAGVRPPLHSHAESARHAPGGAVTSFATLSLPNPVAHRSGGSVIENMTLTGINALLAFAPTPPTGTAPNPTGQMLQMLGTLVFMVVIIYFAMIRPQRKRPRTTRTA